MSPTDLAADVEHAFDVKQFSLDGLQAAPRRKALDHVRAFSNNIGLTRLNASDLMQGHVALDSEVTLEREQALMLFDITVTLREIVSVAAMIHKTLLVPKSSKQSITLDDLTPRTGSNLFALQKLMDHFQTCLASKEAQHLEVMEHSCSYSMVELGGFVSCMQQFVKRAETTWLTECAYAIQCLTDKCLVTLPNWEATVKSTSTAVRVWDEALATRMCKGKNSSIIHSNNLVL